MFVSEFSFLGLKYEKLLQATVMSVKQDDNEGGNNAAASGV